MPKFKRGDYIYHGVFESRGIIIEVLETFTAVMPRVRYRIRWMDDSYTKEVAIAIRLVET